MTEVLLGDGLVGMMALSPGSVGLVLSDLPSGETRARFDVKVDLVRFWDSVRHVLRPAGVVVLMAASFRFACAVRESAPVEPIDLVWEKSLATGHLNAGRRPLKAHEYVLVFVPDGDVGNSVYRPQMTEGATPIHACRRVTSGENYGVHTRVTLSRAGATDRYPTSVLHYGSVGTTSRNRRHPQQKPVSLLRYLVETYSESGDLVVDPCAGSGSTGEAAESCGRRFVGWDIDVRFGGRTISK